MFGFLSKTKSKEKSPEAKQALKNVAPPAPAEGLKDPLTDPLTQGAPMPAPPVAQQAQAQPAEAQAQPAQAQAEKPKAEKGSGFFDRMFKTQSWKRNEATKKAAAVTNQQILDQYWDAAYRFSISEAASENFDCYQAIKGNVTKSSIFNVWIDPKSANNINIPGKVLKPLVELASKGSHDQMDFGEVMRELQGNMADTLSRFQSSDAFIKAIMARM